MLPELLKPVHKTNELKGLKDWYTTCADRYFSFMSSWVYTLLHPGVWLHKPASLGWWCSSSINSSFPSQLWIINQEESKMWREGFAAAPCAADGSASSDIKKALDSVQASLPAWRTDLSRLGHYAYAQVRAVRRVSKFWLSKTLKLPLQSVHVINSEFPELQILRSLIYADSLFGVVAGHCEYLEPKECTLYCYWILWCMLFELLAENMIFMLVSMSGKLVFTGL